MRVRLTIGIFTVLVTAATALAQDRRDRENPELIVESGGRIGSCDSLQFTKDGNYLLAVGDDKVVRIWPYRDGQLHKDGMQVLRWSVWREQRGAIFALALSPDDENKYVAIGGLGPRTGDVAVLERSTGKMIHHGTARQGNAIWSMAYAPDGQQVAFGDSFGGVWTWDFTRDPVRLGKHPDPLAADETNQVRLVYFADRNTVVTIAERGSICQWDATKPDATPKAVEAFGTGGRPIFRVTVSPDHQWYAAAVDPNPKLQGANRNPVVLVRKAGSKQTPIAITFTNNERARAVAFDPESKRLAISVSRPPEGNRYAMDGDDHICFYNLEGQRLKPDGPQGIFRAWCIAFHPNNKDFAIAGGENSDVTLWNLARMDQPVSTMTGVGRALWDVAVSTDGKQVAFRDQRQLRSQDPNDRGQGAWRVFHLWRREWTEFAKFTKVQQQRKYDGWTVEPDAENPSRWYAVHAANGQAKKVLLPLDPKRDGLPMCWAFLPPGDDRPLRLAVGHLWGVSVYALNDEEARRVRLLTGHQGYVTALAASADGSYLVTASLDQTLSGWSLKDYPNSHPVLGAHFEIKNDKLIVDKVAVGSPGWEAGLVAGDEVDEFHFRGNIKVEPGGPKAWKERLESPQPGVEYGFRIRRKGIENTFPLGTTVRQRPLWRFFPTSDGEWALWMWQGAYYDTSTRGDSYLGWLVNAVKDNDAPTFYAAEKFRTLYERPDVLDKLLKTQSVAQALTEALGNNPQPAPFDKNEPPFAAVALTAPLIHEGAAATNQQDVKLMLTITPHGKNDDFQPRRAELWINNHLLWSKDFPLDLEKDLKGPDKWVVDGLAFRREYTLANNLLRTGDNELTFQVYNRLGGRQDSAVALYCLRKPEPPRLFGLAVGVNDYRSAARTGNARDDLQNLKSAYSDAADIQKTWEAQKLLYQNTNVKLLYKKNIEVSLPSYCLRLLLGAMKVRGEYTAAVLPSPPEERATRANILKALDQLAQVVGPDDRCVIFLAGHGLFVEHGAAKGRSPTTWMFCCPDFDPKRIKETSISSEELYRKLAAINGRKLVILDACHSGEAVANPARMLAPSGQGPIIIASCDRNQSAYEDPLKRKHGLFTYALLQAMDGKYRGDADKSKFKTELNARDLYLLTRRQMPELLSDIQQPEFSQVPILFAPEKEQLPLVVKLKD
jgi:WD40 repeat protein